MVISMPYLLSLHMGLFKKYVSSILSIFDPPCTLLYVFKAPSLSVRAFKSLCPPPLTHLLLCLYKINDNAILRLQSSKDSFSYLGCYTSSYRLKLTQAYVRSLKSPLPLCIFSNAFWVLPPFRAQILFERHPERIIGT